MEHQPRRAADQKQDDSIEEILKQITEINVTLKPIAETYRTATIVGKWTMGGAVFISVVIGILLGLKSLIHRS